jgi:hypothetical protein
MDSSDLLVSGISEEARLLVLDQVGPAMTLEHRTGSNQGAGRAVVCQFRVLSSAIRG